MNHFLAPMVRDRAARYRLVNKTRSIVVAEWVQGAFDSRSRRDGLLGRDGLREEEALVIAPSSAIHSFAMKFPIDVLFVTRRGEVLKRVTGLKPYRIAARAGAFAVIEFCGGHPRVPCCRYGDVLAVEQQG